MGLSGLRLLLMNLLLLLLLWRWLLSKQQRIEQSHAFGRRQCRRKRSSAIIAVAVTVIVDTAVGVVVIVDTAAVVLLKHQC